MLTFVIVDKDLTPLLGSNASQAMGLVIVNYDDVKVKIQLPQLISTTFSSSLMPSSICQAFSQQEGLLDHRGRSGSQLCALLVLF